MSHAGHCYCGELRYEFDGDPTMKGQCHCRECQYISGGAVQNFMVVPDAGFKWTQGTPKGFTRRDLENAVTREFCPNCGTHITTRVPQLEGAVVIKVGTLDDPSIYGGPDMAIFACDKQPFHMVPEGIPIFDKVPG